MVEVISVFKKKSAGGTFQESLFQTVWFRVEQMMKPRQYANVSLPQARILRHQADDANAITKHIELSATIVFTSV